MPYARQPDPEPETQPQRPRNKSPFVGSRAGPAQLVGLGLAEDLVPSHMTDSRRVEASQGRWGELGSARCLQAFLAIRWSYV